MTEENTEKRLGYCPVYDLECPSGPEAAASCTARFGSDYNPLTSFRDADIEHCAIYRKEQEDQEKSNSIETNNSSKDGE